MFSMKKLAFWILLVSVGCVGGLIFSSKNFTQNLIELRETKAAAADWKRKAGKAYTEMIKAKGGNFSNIEIIPPAGATVEDGIIYPPADY